MAGNDDGVPVGDRPKVKAFDLAKLPDDAVDLVSRGVDAKSRLGLSPVLAVRVAALVRGLAMAKVTTDLVEKAIADPAWAEDQIKQHLATIADSATMRMERDQEAEAKVLRTLMKPTGQRN